MNPSDSSLYPPRARALAEALQRRILILDGATGTLLQQFGLTENDFRGVRLKDHPQDLKGDNELLCLNRPDVVAEVHRRYLQSGADIITTNTFGATKIGQADYGLSHLARELNVEAARIAREAVAQFEKENPGKSAWVFGSIGPTNRTASLSPDAERPGYRAVTFDELQEAYLEQVEGLVDGGADALILETIFDTLNAKAALFAIGRYFEDKAQRLPVILSVTITDAAGRTLSGQTLEAFWNSVRHARPLAVGINCALGVEQMAAFVQQLSELADCHVCCYPNAGLPNPLSPTGYDETPEHFSQAMAAFADKGFLNIAGGCCGTLPEHIGALALALKDKPPRKTPAIKPALRLSGLEALTLEDGAPFQMVGERTNVMGSPKFKKLVQQGDMAAALEIARQQVQGGANIIDVNFDEALLDGQACMTEFLNLVAAEPDIARVPLMPDSSDWNVLEAALKCAQGKSLVNSLSLKEGEELFLERARLCRRYGAAVIVMAFDENGQAVTREEKVRMCKRAYDLLVTQAAFDPQDIVFDPNVLTVATGMPEHERYALDFIEAIPEIKKQCPHARVSGGISNVSFAFRGNNVVREAMHSVFLFHAIKNGMDLAIVNAGMLANYDQIEPKLRALVEDVLLCKRAGATDELLEYAQTLKGAQSTSAGTQHAAPQWRTLGAEERLREAMVRGLDTFIEDDLAELLAQGKEPLALIEGPLMDGMKQVGALFGEGKLFLPQVVKSARVMKRATAFLQPHIETGKAHGSTHRAKILLATVKGDVHDIGKNIVAVVLRCNNFEVDDLGVMVPWQTILQRAKETKPDIIALSGLITPSLEAMREVAAQLQQNGFSTPLMVGGATTSARHTAIRLAPEYPSALVTQTGDASQMAQLCMALTDARKKQTVSEILSEQALMRAEHAATQKPTLLPLEQARAQAPQWTQENVPAEQLGERIFSEVPLKELIPLINWPAFVHAWGVKRKHGTHCQCGCSENPREDLLADARALLNRAETENRFHPRAVAALWHAQRRGDDVAVFSDRALTQELGVFHFLRQQIPAQNGGQKCLADAVAQEGGVLGGFVATAGCEAAAWAAEFEKSGDPYSALLAQTLADRVAEALSQWLHQKMTGALGIRPAIGYPSIPDHTEKQTLFKLLNATKHTGVTLTETCAMSPLSSVSGLYLPSKEASYFHVGEIADDQLRDYAVRKNWDLEKARKCGENFF